jgi:small subunit ribosomal protein S5
MAFVEQVKEFDEKVIAIDRVARVVKGGRRFRFRAIVVVGDGKGRVGLGIGKGSEVMTSIAKAVVKAKKTMITVPMQQNTIPHAIQIRFSGAEVMLKPASEGTGVIAGGAVRNVVEAAGIRDLLAKSLGSTNKVNNAYATLLALSQLMPAKPQLAKVAAKPQAPAVEAKPAAKKPVAKKAVPVKKATTKPTKASK